MLIKHRLVCSDSGFGRPVDHHPFEVEQILYDGADGEPEEMRIRIRDPGAFGQQLRRDAIKAQLDREPIARREAGSFASPALTISAGADELDARSERERLP